MDYRSFVAKLAVLAVLAVLPQAAAQFETRSSISLGLTIPISFVVGDFNRDGTLDVAWVNNQTPGTVAILLGNGDGTFHAASTYPVAAYPSFAATASLRDNGILDLVFVGGPNDNVYVMLGNGDGTFQPAVPYPTTAEPFMVRLGDFTGGGKLGVVAVEGTSVHGVVCDCVEVLPGNGDGTLGAPITTSVPYNITGYAVTVGDFNHDGKLDLAVAGTFFSARQVDILLGNGDGTFTADGYYSLDAPPGVIVTGNFAGNRNDIGLAVADETAVDVLLASGNGTFEQPVPYLTDFPSALVAQDLNGDGKVDLAASNAGLPPQYPPGVTTFEGNGDGTFESGVFYPAGEGVGDVAVGDFNGDHKPDILLLDTAAYAVITLLNTGVVSFSPTTPLNFQKQVVGTTSKPQGVKLTNTGTTALRIASMKASTEFAVTSTCGSSVAAGANCAISATFSPTKKGSQQGKITIIDSASSKPQVIELLGTGT